MENLSEEGDLLGHPYHDGIVREISIRDNIFNISISKDEAITELFIYNVKAYGIYPLCNNAIISRITAVHESNWSSVSAGKNDPWDILWGGQLFENDLIKEIEIFSNKFKNNFLFILDFSYGGSVSVIGDSWKLSLRT